MNDLTHLIERLEAFEERYGVRLDALFASGDDVSVTVNGELHPREGTELKQDIELKVDIYDSARRLVGQEHKYILAESFFGFATFQILKTPPPSDISKIRIYPTLMS